MLAVDHPKKFSYTWRNEHFPEITAEGHSRVSYELEKVEGATKLALVHETPVANSKLIAGCRDGWPVILASLKSLLETGEPLQNSVKWPEGL